MSAEPSSSPGAPPSPAAGGGRGDVGVGVDVGVDVDAAVQPDVGDLAHFCQTLASQGIDVEQLRTETSGTLCTPEAELPLDVSALPLLGDPTRGLDGDLELKDTIGDGGMGVVRLARQRSLQRDVAVKIVRAVDDGTAGTGDRATPSHRSAMADLVREARIAGGLEHPNIAPVHALARDADGQVLLVMKRIEGRSWASMLAQPAGHAVAAADLRRHLEVLMDICKAVHFAHARGVVHRDLKPANVMVGSFGEVYLLDWGIAVPIGTRTRSISGTPSFLAPEMVTLDAVVDARTDVYLLGGILHLLLSGRPPHAKKTIPESLHAAAQAPSPTLPADAPEELVQVCTRALAARPENRFESAEAFRLAIVAYLEHTAARALVQSADAKRELLSTLTSSTTSSSSPSSSSSGDDGQQDGAVFRAYSAARFGYEQALREWPRFAAARRGLSECHRLYASYELDRRRPDRVRAILADVEAGDAAVAGPQAEQLRAAVNARLAEVDAQLLAEARERERREALARGFDVSARSQSYVTMYILGMLSWVVTVFVVGALARRGTVTPSALHLVGMMSGLTLVFAAMTVFLRVRTASVLLPRLSVLATAASVGIVSTWTAVGVVWPMLSGQPTPVLGEPLFAFGFFVAHLFLGLTVAVMGVFVHRRMAFALIPVVVSLPLLLWQLSWVLEINGLALATTMLIIGRFWPREESSTLA